MGTITFNPSSDKSGTLFKLLEYPSDGVAYTKVNGSTELDSTSIYTGAGVSSLYWYHGKFGITTSSTIPDDEVITNVKLIARVTTQNANQLQKIGLTTDADANEYFSTEFSGTTGFVYIDYSWDKNPATGLSWVKTDLTSPNFYMIVELKQSEPPANFVQCTRFYGEITTSVPSTFVPKIIIS